MGWFEEQVKKRKELDEQTFENSFRSLVGTRNGQNGNLSDTARYENQAIAQILSYYYLQPVDIPANIPTLKEKLNFVLRPHDIQYHPVELTETWIEDNSSPLLTYTKKHHVPVVLLPRGNKGYYYIHYRTGKKVRAVDGIINKIETNAYSFYRPLPMHKVTVKEYIRYLQKTIRPIELAVLIIVSAAVAGVGLFLPYLTRTLTGEVTQRGDIQQLIAVSIYVVATATGLMLLKAVQAYVNSRITIRREKAVQEATMMRLLSLPPSFFKKYNTGELTNRFKAVSTLTTTIINGIFVTLISTVLSLVYLFQLVGFEPSLIPPVVLVLLASTAFTVLIAFIQKKYARKELELSSKESGVTYEMINGIQKIRLAGSEKRVFAKWANAYSRSAKVRYRPPLILRLSTAISLLITLLGNVLIYYVAARNGVKVADYMAFVTSYGMLSAAFVALGGMVGAISTIQPLFEMARPILTTEPETTQGKTVVDKINGNIRFENVTFQYNEKSPRVIDNLSLDIHEGEYVAIVGQTGCGKSTFVRLLLGFEEPTEGHIYYDDQAMEELDLPSLRRHIGTVMQNGSLFHADILSNIIISAPNMTEKEAWHAAEIADIAEDIRRMPMKMKTVISEGQGGISGGQKQRIMIARAIVHQPKILIFDEATSALDNKTQKSISESIAKLNCTRIVIAHRLSTIQHADRILLLDGGKIIESGDYETLIQQKGRFAELVARQRLDGK